MSGSRSHRAHRPSSFHGSNELRMGTGFFSCSEWRSGGSLATNLSVGLRFGWDAYCDAPLSELKFDVAQHVIFVFG